jgi:hypothetical protein
MRRVGQVGIVLRQGGDVPGVFVIVRDARGSLVHVRRRSDGECVGCIEAGLFEIVRALALEEPAAAARRREESARPPLSDRVYDAMTGASVMKPLPSGGQGKDDGR